MFPKSSCVLESPLEAEQPIMTEKINLQHPILGESELIWSVHVGSTARCFHQFICLLRSFTAGNGDRKLHRDIAMNTGVHLKIRLSRPEEPQSTIHIIILFIVSPLVRVACCRECKQ